MTGGGTAAQEKVTIQASQYTAGGAAYTIKIYAESTSGPVPIVNGMLIKNSIGNTVDTITGGSVTGTLTLTTGTLATINGAGSTATLPSGTYTATLTTKAGGNFVSQSFVVP
jgi:hypothetical protein